MHDGWVSQQSRGRGLGVRPVGVVVLGSFRRRFEPLDHVS